VKAVFRFSPITKVVKDKSWLKNPFAAMVFYWAHIGRQLRIEGRVERLSDEESDRYFAGRSFKIQISALVSKQSRPIEDEAKFLQALDKVELVHQNQQASRPESWGGFKLIPSRFEFWTRGEHRRHRRIVYDEHGGDWRKSRLYP
jgi:pyridoxamine 5'-phosphate oxidase